MKYKILTLIILTILLISCQKEDNQDTVIGENQIHDELTTSVVTEQQIPWGIQRVGHIPYIGTNKVWLVDAGVDGNHPDLNINRRLSKSFVDDFPLVDNIGHGTQIAGVVGAIDNNFGVVGVAAGVEIVSVKVFGASVVTRPNKRPVPSGVSYACRRASKGDVIVISFAVGSSMGLDDIITKAANRGIYFCIASGQSNAPTWQSSPQRVSHPNVFVVSGFRFGDYIMNNCNYGSNIIYSQPSVGILTTHTGGGYRTVTGTSYAAPHLAGVLLTTNFAPVNGGTVVGSDIQDGILDIIATIK